MNIVIIGSNGQLGTDLTKTFQTKYNVTSLKHEDIEVTDSNSCQTLKQYNPNIIINTAAFHKTDQCEEEPLKTFQVNALGARNITKICQDTGATPIYISTDYVFDGTKRLPYTEKDQPNPINTYGISKLAGELYTKQNPQHYIIRVSSLFGAAGASGKGGNFIETMLTKANKNEPITVVNDMTMTPTYTKDAANAIAKIIDQQLPPGIYHATNQGYCTWYEFAKEIFIQLQLNPNLTPTKTNPLQYKAKRPMYSAMESPELKNRGITTPTWKQALANYLTEKGHLKATH
jgi:dTDP-4-dehydrorhamnose reductase